MARQKKEVDASMVRDLAKIACTTEEIAQVCKCSKDTIERRFMDILEEGRAHAKMSLRRKQFQIAMDDEHKSQATMCIWLGKQLLGQKEPDRTPPPDDTKADAQSLPLTDEQADKIADKIIEARRGRT